MTGYLDITLTVIFMTGFPGIAVYSLKTALHGEYLGYLLAFLSTLIIITTALNAPYSLRIQAVVFGGIGILFGAVSSPRLK